MKNIENKEGFKESVLSKYNSSNKIPFFHLGPKIIGKTHIILIIKKNLILYLMKIYENLITFNFIKIAILWINTKSS